MADLVFRQGTVEQLAEANIMTTRRFESLARWGILVVILFTLAGVSADDAQPGVLRSEFIYETAPFAQCHASTLAETKAGLVAAWFGGKREGDPSVGIWVSRHEDGKWTAPVEVATGLQPDGSRLPCWNPVVFQPKDGPLLLFYKV